MAGELFISRRGGQTWAALCERGRTVELRVELSSSPEHVGRIVKARVSKVIPGIQSAFLSMGTERDGFLHVTDLLLPGEQPQSPPRGSARDRTTPEEHPDVPDDLDPDSLEESIAAQTAASGPTPEAVEAPAVRPPIEDRLKVGRELVVQVARGSLGTKGERVTCYLTLPGRRLVLFPQLALRSVSRRIDDADERARLQSIVERLPGGEVGFVARTASWGSGEEQLEREARFLLEEWERVGAKAEAAPVPSVVHQELGLLFRLLRDAPADGLERIVVDQEEDRQRALDYLLKADPQLASAVELHLGPEPLFEAYGLDQEIERAMRPRVWLKSGGYIVIEQTEALVSIDVNTGKYVGRRRMEETVLKTNLEACEEIARQLRLRDLGGIIVIDFIDMDLEESRRQVIDTLETALRHDRARTKVHGLSELGLLQLARKRTRPGLEAELTRGCPLCSGQGRIKNPRSVAFAALSEIQRLEATASASAFVIRAHPEVVMAVRSAGPGPTVKLVEDPQMRPDQYVLQPGTTDSGS